MTDKHTEVGVHELEAIAKRLLGELRKMRGDTVVLDENLYWKVHLEDLYVADVRPKELTLGDLVDEWEWLCNSLRDGDAPVSYDLVWLGELLKHLGLTIEV